MHMLCRACTHGQCTSILVREAPGMGVTVGNGSGSPRGCSAVALALPGTARAALGQMEATAQPVPPRRAMLALHLLQLWKASEQLLIVPAAANEIISVWCWEPLPSPALPGPCCWGQRVARRYWHGLGSHRAPGVPRVPQCSLTPFTLCPYCSLAAGDGTLAGCRGGAGREGATCCSRGRDKSPGRDQPGCVWGTSGTGPRVGQ